MRFLENEACYMLSRNVKLSLPDTKYENVLFCAFLYQLINYHAGTCKRFRLPL